MEIRGDCKIGEEEYGAILKHSKKSVELILTQNGAVRSAYKFEGLDEYSFINKKARDIWVAINKGYKGCTAKNGVAVPFELGTAVRHQLSKSKVEYCIDTFNNEICLVSLNSEDGMEVFMEYVGGDSIIPSNMPYIKLTRAASDFDIKDGDEGLTEHVVVRPVEEIALEKTDITWLKNKKYYIVNDDEEAEKIFQFLDNYEGVIAYDVETTGLKINCFSKINSKYMRELEQWNMDNPDDQIRADRLVGVIFCVEKDVSYYFPVFNRKFKNLYEDKDSEVRRQVLKEVKYKYIEGELKNREGDMAEYVRNTPEDEFSCDVILMERIRNILETKHIVPHNASFEWKVGWCYEIDTNIKDDTMILHQMLYKFRSTTHNRGEPSRLDYLSQREFGVEQWTLSDFFPDFESDKTGEVRNKGKRKKSGSHIDFSYMDYTGTKIYAPTDGDMTFQLLMKYKRDLLTNHKEQIYLYNVEVLVACAIAYMEFYGHKLDEDKIEEVKNDTKARLAIIESEFRQMIEYSDEIEMRCYEELKNTLGADDGDPSKEKLEKLIEDLERAISNNEEYVINLASPIQMASLFYDKLDIPMTGGRRSVDAKAVKPLLSAKDEGGNNQYPIVHLYAEYKKMHTLLTKFFDNLIYFMYPGGYIFSSFGQISTATGRMSASKPNCQQYPNAVTKIVVPRENYIMIDADYSQIEYRVLVALAGEEKLAETFKCPDNDYHTLMASRMYDVPYASVTPQMRSDAKDFNFGIPYGMGFKSLAIKLTGKSGRAQIEEAKVKYELYFKDQPKVRKFFDQVKEMASVNKHTKTFWNRYRYYSFYDKDGNISNFKKGMVLRQAGNAVIQGTAADIFKIGMARTFLYIRQNKLFGKLLITNMIHDEVLFESNMDELNTQRILRDIGINLSFNINGFPPLFIGVGVGNNWSEAKGKNAEIHPHLLETLSKEVENISMYNIDNGESSDDKRKDIIDYFRSRIEQFNKNKIIDYVTNKENYNKDIHPVIGNLINTQFTYGRSKEGLSNNEFTMKCLEEFLEKNNVNIDISLFNVSIDTIEDEEDKEYDDIETDFEEEEYDETDFALIDESDVLYGSSTHDLIRIFGFVVSKTLRICGVDITKLSYRQRDKLIRYLEGYVCEMEDEGSMEIVFLLDSNIIKNTGVWVKGIEGSEIETRIKIMHSEEV